MKLEVGKYYRTRDGRKVGPLESSDYGDAGGYYIEGYGLIKPDGRFGYGSCVFNPDLDLVAEWVDEPEQNPLPQHPTELPDVVALKIADVAREHGYFLSVLELCWITADGISNPLTASVRYAASEKL